MHVAKDDIEVKLQIPGAAVLRQRTEFGDATGLGKISGEYFSLSAGVDTTSLLQGLDGDACQCPHWGYVLRGELATTDAKGNEETVRQGDLFYWPAGHNVKVRADAELILFSPQREHTRVIDHMRGKVNGR
jgi:uncharacterized cupin superfamily protein